MMKQIKLIFIILSVHQNSNAYILGVYDQKGYNFQTQIFSIENKPEMLLQAPAILLDNLINYFIPGVTFTSLGNSSFVDFLYKNNIKFYTYIWGQPIDKKTKPKNRQYNIAFHHDVQNWLNKKEGNFNLDVPMGLFEPNGVKEIKSDLPEVSRPISFNKLSLRNVVMHDGTTRLSPNNVQFELEENRNVVTFWTMALSSDKNNGIVVFNIFVDEDKIQDDFSKLITNVESSKDLNTLINGIKFIANNLKNPNDSKALNDSALTLENLPTPVENIIVLFFNRAFNKNFLLFPITFPITLVNLNDPIFQFRVLSQYLDGQACIRNIVAGNTCGRHSFKNAIFGILALNSYGNDKANFEKYANNLMYLNPESQCLFQKINEKLKQIRGKSGININEATLSKEEVLQIMDSISEITTSCSLPEFNKNQFSVISDVTTLISQLKTGATEFDEDLIMQIEKFRTDPNYQHAFIIGAGKSAGEHWYTIIVDKSKVVKAIFIPMDSADNADRIDSPFTQELLKILTDPAYANPNQIRIEIFSAQTLPSLKNSFSIIEKDLTNLSLNKINGKDINTLSYVQQNDFVKKIFSNIIQLAQEYIETFDKLTKINPADQIVFKKELDQIEKFLSEDFTKMLSSIPLLKDIENFEQVTKNLTEIIQQFLKTKDKKTFTTNTDNLIKNIKIKARPNLKNLEKYEKQFPNLLTNPNEIVQGKSVLHVAVTNKDLNAVKEILNIPNSNINVQTPDKVTALHFAVFSNLPDIAKYLIDKGIDKSIKKSNGETALDQAVRLNRVEIVKLLQ